MRKSILSLTIAILLLLPSATYGLGAVLGDPPEETPAERACASLIVADAATGAILLQKDADAQFDLVGGMVRVMAALTALDYMDPDDTIELEEANFGPPADARSISFRAGKTYLVEDILCAMLVHCASNAALVLGGAVEKAAGAGSFISLMNEKAAALGMEDTRYVNATGSGGVEQATCARDQLILAQAALENEAIRSAMAAYEYRVKSSGAGLPDVMYQYSGTMLPNDAFYDPRVGAVARGSGASETSILIRAQSEGREIILVMLYPSNQLSQVYAAVGALLDAYLALQRLDLTQSLAEKAASVTMGVDEVALPWQLRDGQALTVSAYDDFAFDPAKLLLTPDEGSYSDAGNGVAALTAQAYYQDVALGQIELVAPLRVKALPSPTPGATQGVKNTPSPLPVFNEGESVVRSGFMRRYGWLVCIAAAAILCAAGIALGRLLRERL